MKWIAIEPLFPTTFQLPLAATATRAAPMLKVPLALFAAFGFEAVAPAPAVCPVAV